MWGFSEKCFLLPVDSCEIWKKHIAPTQLPSLPPTAVRGLCCTLLKKTFFHEVLTKLRTLMFDSCLSSITESCSDPVSWLWPTQTCCCDMTFNPTLITSAPPETFLIDPNDHERRSRRGDCPWALTAAVRYLKGTYSTAAVWHPMLSASTDPVCCDYITRIWIWERRQEGTDIRYRA